MKILKLTIFCIIMLCMMFLSGCKGKQIKNTNDSTVKNSSITQNVSEEALKAREEFLTDVGVFDDIDKDSDESNIDVEKKDDVVEKQNQLFSNNTYTNEENDSDTLRELIDVPSGF